MSTRKYSILAVRLRLMLIFAALWCMGAKSSCSGDGEPSRTVCTENSHCESWFGPDEVCDLNQNVCLPPEQAHPGICGDNRVTGLEDCDDGTNPPQDCVYGPIWSCNVCNGNCREVNGIAHYCGDGELDSANGEVCDDAGATWSGDTCSSNCVCTSDAGLDADGDEICGNVDVCPNTWDPWQHDYDNDGMGNECDPCPTELGNGCLCTPNCNGRVCGDDGCGGTCGTCSSGESCTPGGQCQGENTGPNLDDCTGTLVYVGDGFCDGSNNNAGCAFDGGDCCESTCEDGTATCGGYVDPVTGDAYACQDPEACENQEAGCTECAAGCSPSAVGNGTCDPACYNEACGYDTSSEGVKDCSCDEVGLNEDCDNKCFGASYLSWRGDGVCDDGEYGLNLNCAAWENDGGDCVNPVDPEPEPEPEPEDCAGNASYSGDGWCDSINNNTVCGYDGGDCCASTCSDGASYQCGQLAPYNCQDPGACENSNVGCQDSEQSCEDQGLQEDCQGTCFSSDGGLLGNGVCNDGPAPDLDLSCAVWSNDNGDCSVTDPGDNRENVTIELRADYYFTQCSAYVRDQWGNTVSDIYDFTTFNEMKSEPLSLSPGQYSVRVVDSNGDGGLAGYVTILGQVAVSWEADDYTTDGSFSFTVE